jgi:hypothetical protein
MGTRLGLTFEVSFFLEILVGRRPRSAKRFFLKSFDIDISLVVFRKIVLFVFLISIHEHRVFSRFIVHFNSS